MGLPGWLNRNSARNFPFTSRVPLTVSVDCPDETCFETSMPTEVILDFGATFLPDSFYSPTTDKVFLHSIVRDGDDFIFSFSTNSAVATGTLLVFRRALTDPEFAAEFVEADAGEHGSPLGETVLWKGYLVTGALDQLADLMPDGATLWAMETISIEPALIEIIEDTTFVRSINTATYRGPRLERDEDCSNVWLPTVVQKFANANAMQGHVRFAAGYNAVIKQNAATNSIVFGAEVGAGIGELCEEVKVTDDDTAPDGSVALSGGPVCSELVRCVNGIVTPKLTLRGGAGFSVIPHPTLANTLLVTLDNSNLAGCIGEAPA